MRRRVLVTRPEPGASATARALEAAGYEPVVLPLTEIRPLPSAATAGAARFSAVAATSANALRHAPSGLLDGLRHLPLFAVGDATAEAARQVGFAIVETGAGNATALASSIAAKLPAGADIAYLCGTVRKPDLQARLAAAGIGVTPLETYAAVGLTPSAADVAAIASRPLFAVLVYSEEGAKALAALHQMPSALASALHVCLSGAVSRSLPEGTSLRIASKPTETAMLAALTHA